METITLFIRFGCSVEMSRKDAEKLMGEKRVEDLIEILAKSECTLNTRHVAIPSDEVEDYNYDYGTSFPEERVRFGAEHKSLDVKFLNARD